ncbi:SDR family NAD(P)-dependent oxidoreductase [Aquisediminimonas sediminicola]|uniref:SDR family NAD(P)-dependent oxidoreductase n=1 Tax=Alteraquisediminimonas sediminicola TaxID=2676787 RepID=UPI001C8E89F4|nr:SDR family NAD(P)-dependent oxidoreductase [Aquisediminimonas sediminicola]
MTQPSNAAQRRWLVTGASRGLGHAIATIALMRGDRVCLVARSADIVDIATALGPNAMGVQADVCNPDALAALCNAVAARWGGIDVLVNNAGLHRGGKVDGMSVEDWEQSIATNLSGPMHTVRAVLPHMPSGGAIVNIGAVVGFRGFPGDSCYGASKAGLAGLTQVLAAELASRQIRVNLVVPGFVMTEMTATVSERAREKIVAKIPLRRMGRAEEIADVCWWVAGSTYMTGSVVMTDGGLMCNL